MKTIILILLSLIASNTFSQTKQNETEIIWDSSESYWKMMVLCQSDKNHNCWQGSFDGLNSGIKA